MHTCFMVEVGLMPFINENAPDVIQVLYWLDVTVVAVLLIDIILEFGRGFR